MATKFPTVEVSELAQRGLVPDATPPRPLVLVVDDEPMIAETLAAIFESAGFAATAAYDAEGALEIANLTPPDLLLSDVIMPGLNGTDLAAEITNLVPDCRIILLAALDGASDGLARSPIVDGHITLLTKPIHPRDLLSEVSRIGIRGMPGLTHRL